MEMTEAGVDSGKSGLQEGYSRCEFCNYVGKSESFFSKSKRFCSCVCSRSYSSSKRDKSHHSHNSKTHEKKIHLLDKNMKKNAVLNACVNPKPVKASKAFEWTTYMETEDSSAAPVSCFNHCPFNEFWKGSMVGTVVEAVNTDPPSPTPLQPVYWFAMVTAVQGYYVRLRYVGCDEGDFWRHLCGGHVHPVGWSASNGRDIVAPSCLQGHPCNSKKYLVEMLTGAWTYPDDLVAKATDNSYWPLVAGMRVEVVDKLCISSMKAAVVEENKGGRLKLKYLPSGEQQEHFWCHSLSHLVHPVGWSSVLGHHIDASHEYKAASLSRATFKQYLPHDATPGLFAKMAQRCNLPLRNQLSRRSSHSDSGFVAGMKLEAVDPLNLNNICVATVARVLKGDHVMVTFDSVDDKVVALSDNGADQIGSFCFHTSSSYLLPAGFCEINKLPLTPPRGYKQAFDWVSYLQERKAVPAPLRLFQQEAPKHSFKTGMKVEAVDLMEPRMICVATIHNVVGRLLKIGFDGWGEEYDQWVDCQSVDIYPPGWCQLFSFKLEPPRQFNFPDPLLKNKKTARGHIFKGGRKRRRIKTLTPDHHPLSMSVCVDDEEEDDDDEDGNYIYKKTSLLASRDKDFFSESSPIYSPYESDLETRASDKTHKSERQNIFCQLSGRESLSGHYTSLLLKPPPSEQSESLAT